VGTEIREAGYQSIRDFVEANWIYINLEDDTGTEILRISTSDSRVTWTHSAGSQVLELEIIVSGGDSDISLPQTFASSSVYAVATGGDILSRDDAGFETTTFQTTADTLTTTHQIEIPNI